MAGAVVRFRVLAIAAALAAMASGVAVAQSGANCIDADPTGELADSRGNYSLSVDPTDSQHILFVNNGQHYNDPNPQDVVVAQIDAVTGQFVPGSKTKVARNFLGHSQQNGPEWMETPGAQLGILYSGTGGVYGVYRQAAPTAWNAFTLNWNGSATSGTPSLLPDTLPETYPGTPVKAPSTAAVIPQVFGTCTHDSTCYGAYNGGTTTDILLVLASEGYKYYDSTQPQNSSSSDGQVYFSACATSTTCGLYQGKIDGEGGLSYSEEVASMGSVPATRMAAARHPVTNTMIIFTDGLTANTVNIWEQVLTDGPPSAKLTLMGAIAIPSGYTHFRALVSPSAVVVNFFVRKGSVDGTYAIQVGANPAGTALVIGTLNLLSTSATGGSSLKWLGAAGQWALFYRTKLYPTVLWTRCWVDP